MDALVEVAAAAAPKKIVKPVRVNCMACCCAWPDCKELRKFFEKHDPSGFGGPVYNVTFIKRGEEKIKHRQALLSVLGIPAGERYEKLMQRESIGIARHHYDPRQVRLFNQNRRDRSNPFTEEALKQYTNVPVDPKYSLKNDDKGSEDKPLYYHLPNYPHEEVKLDVEALKDGKTTVRLIQRIQKEEQQEKAEFLAMTYEEYKQKQQQNQPDTSEIEKLKSQVASLKEKVSDAKAELKTSKKRESRNQTKLQELQQTIRAMQEQDKILTLPRVNWFLQDYGGLNRLTITSDTWHNENKGAAKHLFGFKTWDDMKKHIQTNFKDVNVHFVSKITLDGLVQHEKDIRRGHKSHTFTLSAFEECVAAKLYLHRIPVALTVAIIMGVSPNKMGRIVAQWTPRWKGKADDQEPASKKQKTSSTEDTGFEED